MATHLKSISLALLLGSTGCIVPLHASSVGNMSAQNTQQQKHSCSGVVLDDNGEPVIGASIMIKGTSKGTITNLDGQFDLAEAKKGDVLVITYIGMNPVEVKYAGNSLKVTLKDDTHNLNEVVVTGYGGQQKRGTLTTAISKMDDKVLDNAAFGNVGQALQGTVTGLSVVNTSGQPGSEPTITLRGGASIQSSTDALVIIDGVVRSLSDINSSDIESIEVLKDAAATAIYGARANGGVILVTTKSGKAGRTSITYKTKLGINFKRNDYDFLDAHDYIYYNRLGVKRYNNSCGYTAADVDNQNGYSGFGAYKYGDGSSYFTPMTDVLYKDYATVSDDEMYKNGWKLMDDPYYFDEDGSQLWYRDYSGQVSDAAFRKTTLTQDHYIGVSGGSDVSTFAASLGYYDEDGIVRGTGYKRFNGSINGSYKIKPTLKVNGGASLTWSQQPATYFSSIDDLYYRTRSQRPTWNPYYEDGSPAAGWSSYDSNIQYWLDKFTSENSYRTETFNLGFD